LIRFRATQSLDGQSRDARFATLSDAIRPHPKYGADLKARAVVVVDDVMTSGATLAACTEACRAAGAREVDVLTLARVAKDA
jgi:predicted amidophosphoribosyltransferase